MKKQKKAYTQKLVVSEASTRELQAVTMYESGNLAVVSQLLNQCLQEDDSIKQCTLLKKAGALLQGTDWKSGEVFPGDLKKCLTFLAEVFVICDVKNPSRKVVASTFDNLPVHWCSDVFSNVFLDKLKEISKEILELGKTPSVRHNVDLISDMLEYFSLGTNVLLCNGSFVVEFLTMCLNKECKDARSETSPTLQTACMWNCLVTIKTIITFLQKLNVQHELCGKLDQLTFDDQAQNTVVSTEHGKSICCNQRNLTAQHDATKSLNHSVMEMLSDLCSVMFDDQFFPDCRTTAGMAIIVVLRMLCPPDGFVATTGKLIFPSRVSGGEIIQSIADEPKIISYFQQCKDIVNFSHLCLCRGVLTMVPLQALTQRTEFTLSDQGKLGTLFFDALFPDLCSLCDGLKESSSCLLAFRTLTLWANHARQIATSEQCVASWLKGKFHGTSPIATRLLSYVWTAWDHPVEGVRYETKLIFEHVVSMHLIVDSVGDTFLKDLIASLVKVGWHVRGKYGPLGCMASIVGATKMLLWFPSIPQELFPFMKERGLVPHIMDFIDKMAISHRREITETGKDIQEWLEVRAKRAV